MEIKNTYYIAVDKGNATLYAPFLHNGEAVTEDGSCPAGVQTEFSAMVSTTTALELADATTAGLAARMTADSNQKTTNPATFKCVKVQINDIETITCVVSETVANLIADRIVD